MNRLHELLKEKMAKGKLTAWPKGIEVLCVSRRGEWMLKHIQGAERVPGETGKFFNQLGPCSSLYRGMSCNEQQFNDLREPPNGH